MKLDSKQMHIVSQLFLAAGKAGQPFDLGRLTKDPVYAAETVAALSVFADQQRNNSLQSLAALTMDILASVAVPAPPAAVPEVSPAPTPAAAPVSQKYVGQLR